MSQLNTAVLFEPLTVRGVTLANRIVCPPMVSNRRLNTPDGIAWYARFAAGGPGLVIVEATGLDRFDSEFTAANLRPLVDAIHEGMAIAVIQLIYGKVRDPALPADIPATDLARAPEQFAHAAAVAVEAGFDGVELHGAHGFLLNKFFSPLANRRTDAWGGGLEERMKLGLDSVLAVRQAVGPGPLIAYRHTPRESNDGYPIADSLVFAEHLVAAGVDLLDISPASDVGAADLAAPFRALGIAPVIGVGRMGDPTRAVAAIEQGNCDLVAIGRGLIADPQWPEKVSRGALFDLIVCEQCDQGCFGNLRAGRPVECVLHER